MIAVLVIVGLVLVAVMLGAVLTLLLRFDPEARAVLVPRIAIRKRARPTDGALILIDPDGKIRLLWDDELAPTLRELGPTAVVRASHVEPADDGWTANMGPVGGPVLGPVGLRQEALGLEKAYLIAHSLPAARGEAE